MAQAERKAEPLHRLEVMQHVLRDVWHLIQGDYSGDWGTPNDVATCLVVVASVLRCQEGDE